MGRGLTARIGLTALFGIAMAVCSSGTELDTLIARLSARLDPIETFEANARIFECG